LSLTFTDKIVLPEWMDKIKIDEFKVKGKISPSEVKKLIKRFPKLIINNISYNYDIVVNSGALGVPLIVVNGKPFKVTQKFDYANARDEDYAELIGVEPDDIKNITVFKDAAATTLWGERGKWGVIEIKTKGKVKKSNRKILTVSGTVSDAEGPLWMTNVVEVNEQNRIVGHAVTDTLGHFTLKVVNPKDKIRVSYIGTKTMTLDIYKKKYDIIMQPSTMLRTVDVQNERKRRLR
ncbi:MAG: hypothetical protein J5790_03725, partial [Bacteroidaceae bacterium]|nr:hypothetical protein [Bacteroidaceae bacterium]